MLTKLFVKSTLALEEFKKDQRGVTAIEYAIIGVAVSAIVITVFNGDLQDALQTAIGTISTNISTAGTATP